MAHEDGTTPESVDQDVSGCGGGGRGLGRGRGAGRCCGGKRHASIGRGALVEPAVIAALISSGGHGYDLRREIAELTGDSITVDSGGLYRVLRRLEDEGFVSSTWVQGDAGPQRREYELADEAHDLARDWVVHLREREQLAGMLAGVLERVANEREDSSQA
ncbi:MAG: PadR family transcriptional regulator [Actinomycetota bacterium]|nr:PadR family transcriptional regulator [Actinomycetota bacterium]